MTTIEEHATRIAEMKAAEARVRAWLKDARLCLSIDDDVRLLLERIDAYEASITWHTDCLTCPKLYDQIYEMEQHTIPAMRAALDKADVLVKCLYTPGIDEESPAVSAYRQARAKVKL